MRPISLVRTLRWLKACYFLTLEWTTFTDMVLGCCSPLELEQGCQRKDTESKALYETGKDLNHCSLRSNWSCRGWCERFLLWNPTDYHWWCTKARSQIGYRDLNAKVGSNIGPWQRVLGHHGIGDMNNNGLRLVEFCAENDMVVGGTIPTQNYPQVYLDITWW